MKIYLSRWNCNVFQENINNLKLEVSKAVKKGSEIIVFPEIFLTGYKQKVANYKIEEVFKNISSKYFSALFIFGSYSKNKRNRLTVWYKGKEVAFYEKVHLFLPNGENKIWESGKFYSALNFKGKKIGFLICNDLRFPESARNLKLNIGIDMLIIVGWWPLKRNHIWKKLLQARAIENSIWAVGCCISSSIYKKELFSGALNYVFDPLGNQIFPEDDNIYLIDGKRLKALVDTVKEFKDINKFKFFKI